jgi:hypothetical protein
MKISAVRNHCIHIVISPTSLVSADDGVNVGWISPTYFFISPTFSKFLVTGGAAQTSHHNNYLSPLDDV